MIDKWVIPKNAFQASVAEMAIDGKRGNEGIALWLGKREIDTVTVTHVGLLRGNNIVKHPHFLQVEAAAFNAVTDVAIELGVYLVGQIHSHGPYVGTFLSPTDRTMGVLVPDYLSAVCPDYGLRQRTDPRDCGFYFYDSVKGFVELSQAEIEKKIVLSNQKATILEIPTSA